MRKKILIASAIAVFLFLLIFVNFTNSEVMCSGGTKTCIGECCKADASGCTAGPCIEIFPDEFD